MSDTPKTDAFEKEQARATNVARYYAALRELRDLERENTAQKAALAKSASALSAFLGFHAEALPLEAVRGLSDLLKEIQPLIKP